ncbi:MAG: phosphatase PAP2 family protein [Rubrivivax sp.]
MSETPRRDRVPCGTAIGIKNRHRLDWIVTALALLLLLAWDASGWDLQVMHAVGSAQGFPARDAWWASRLLHDGGRIAAWSLLVLLVVDAIRRRRSTSQSIALSTSTSVAASTAPSLPGRAERLRWLAVMLAAALLIPTLKRISRSSCPWDLQAFGGSASYVSHWQWGVVDGGPGHCFPSGHAVAAFAFFGLYFLWRDHRPRLARWMLAAVCAAGLLFGAAQSARGAHYPSHTLWTAWFAWTLCVVAARGMPHRMPRS